MKVVRGDLIQLALEGKFDVIIHGCNCQCTMGAGIAKSIKDTFPEAFAADCRTDSGNREKLGTVTSATVEKNGHSITIVNAYTQFHWRGKGVQADYPAIKSAMRTVKQNWGGSTIGYPLIGAGLAGGEWEIISEIIDAELEGEDHTLVEYVRN